LPYNYSLAYEQTSSGKSLLRPLFYYDGKDTNLLHAQDEYMWGDAFLVAPVLQPGATERKLYLPKGEWYGYYSGDKKTGGVWISDKTTLNNIPVYVKAGSFIPTWQAAGISSTAQYSPAENITVRYYPYGGTSTYNFFDDDGRNPASIPSGQFQLLVFTGSTVNNICRISVIKKKWPSSLKRNFAIQVPASISRLLVDNTEVPLLPAANGWKQAMIQVFTKTQK